MKPATPLIAVIALLVGIFIGLQLEIAHLPNVLILGKTDGALCFSQSDLRNGVTEGPHWLVRADGLCWVADMPR